MSTPSSTPPKSTPAILQTMARDPVTIPPYFTPRGIVTLTLCLTLMLVSLLTYALGYLALAAFLATFSATALAIIAAAYAKLLLSWHTLHANAASIRLTNFPAQTCHTHARFSFDIILSNPLPWKLFALAFEPHASRHLFIQHKTPLPIFSPKTSTVSTFDATCIAPGKAAIWGMRLAGQDGAAIFRCEIHLELHDTHLNILPNPSLLPHSRVQHRPPAPHQHSEDHEFDRIRPLQHGDNMRRIFWRGFAKTSQLQTITYAPLLPEHVVIILDASSPMRRPLQHDPNLTPFDLACAHLLAPAASNTLNSLWLIPAHGKPYVLCQRTTHAMVQRMLQTWYLQTSVFQWPPARHAQEGWRQAAKALWQDLSTYKSLDFRIDLPKGTLIDTRMMAQWSRTSTAAKALQQDDIQSAKDIYQASDVTILTDRLRTRRLEPDLANLPASAPEDTHTPFDHIALSPPGLRPTRIVWVSNLAYPLTLDTIKALQNVLAQKIPISLCLCPIPAADNIFDAKSAKQRCTQNLALLRKWHTLVDIFPLRQDM